MAVALVQSKHFVQFNYNGDFSASFDSATTSGNLIVAYGVSNSDNQEVLLPTGFNELWYGSGFCNTTYDGRIGTYVSTGETSFTFPSTDTSRNLRIVLLEFSGAETTDIVNRAVAIHLNRQEVEGSSDKTIDVGPYSPEFDSGILYAIFHGNDARTWRNGTHTVTAGWTTDYDQTLGSNQPYAYCAYKSISATTEESATFTTTDDGAARNVGFLLHIKEPNSIDPVNRVLNGAIAQDIQSQRMNRVMNGFIFQEKAATTAAPAPGSAETWIWHKIEQGIYSEPGASMGGVLIE